MSNHPPYRERLQSLFSDIERLASNPAVEATVLKQQIEELRARLGQLETDIHEMEKHPEPQESAPIEPDPFPVEETKRGSTPILYEKEFVGYAFSGEQVQPLNNAISPKVYANISAPLIVGGQAIGNMQIAAPSSHGLSPEEKALLNAVAQRASQQIENLRLLSEAERARAEAEAATHQFMHESWDSFLDAIHQRERIGYAYDQASVIPFLDKTSSDGGVMQSVNVLDEQVGSVYVKPDPSRPLSEKDKEMIAAIASQVAQQVENIRLLADAARARAEAEEATRRLTRENWQNYVMQREREPGFTYDLNQVTPLQKNSLPKMDTTLPLTVRGEVIGQLGLSSGGAKLNPEAHALAASIAQRVSAHLETIRLTEELQKRAVELESVAQLSTTASTVLDPDELLQSVVDMAKKSFGLYHAHIYLANDSWNTLLLASGADKVGRAMVAEQHTIPMDAERSLVARAARERQAVIVNDVRTELGYLANPFLPDTRSEMAVPMIVGGNVIGVFDVQSELVGHFTAEDANIYTTLTSQVSVALQNARLYQEQAATVIQLRELDRLKSSFLANMSHELRTPLNSILGFSDVMLEELDGPLTENMNNDLKLIQKNGQHLLHLINDVLDMAKIEAGRMNLNPEKFLLHETFEEVTSITSTLASEKNIVLFIENDSDKELHIFADRTRIRQVLINLVNNAIKFTDKGKISIHAERRNDRVLIAVRDTGLGIPPDKLEAVFQEFTQVDTTTTRKVGGTGLGLPISRRLIEMHGGRLWAESTGVDGEGSTFYVDMPLEAVIEEPDVTEKAKI